jgi:hypothetical protein
MASTVNLHLLQIAALDLDLYGATPGSSCGEVPKFVKSAMVGCSASVVAPLGIALPTCLALCGIRLGRVPGAILLTGWLSRRCRCNPISVPAGVCCFLYTFSDVRRFAALARGLLPRSGTAGIRSSMQKRDDPCAEI